MPTDSAQALFARDFLFEVMKDSQRLRAGYLAERERWLRTLAVDGREEVLFEFEMLLRSLERYFNVHNLPLESQSEVLSRDFREELGAVGETIGRAVQLTQLLLDPPSNRNLVFRKYLESQLADDRTRGKLLEQQLSQETPQESLFLLRSGFAALRGVLEALLRLPNHPYQLFVDVGQLVVREVALNKYFRPFRPLEFRSEYDRIKSVRILEILRRPMEGDVPGERVRRLVSLAFLAFFRLLHYLRYVPVGRDEQARRSFLTLALVRSEATSLAAFLEGELAAALVGSGPRPAAGVSKLAVEIRKEVAKVYKRHLASVTPADRSAGGKAREAFEGLFKQWVTLLAQLFEETLDGREIFDDYVSRQEQARRLRQDLWAFREVCRRVERTAQRGSTEETEGALRGLRRFLAYFHDVSYQLLRYGDYGPFDRFIQIVQEADVARLGQPRVRRQLRDDCRAFGEVLAQTFAAVSKREELGGQPFVEAEANKVIEELGAFPVAVGGQ
jgi:hypothetical protein